jgi:primosomal protein N' (replication factor Y) (superfamily II helicase)
MNYAEIAIDPSAKGVTSTFTYHIPPALEGQIVPGHLVRVSFGTAMQNGIVLDLTDIEPNFKTKPILDILDPQPVMTPYHLGLAIWLSRSYLAPIGACLWLMLPPGFTGRSQKRIFLKKEGEIGQNALEFAVLERLAAKPVLIYDEINRELKDKGLQRALSAMEKRGIIEVQAELTRPTVKPRTVKTVRLLDSTASLRSDKQKRVIAYLMAQDMPLDVEEVVQGTETDTATVSALEKKGLVTIGERFAWRDSLADRDFISSSPPTLTEDQEGVWQPIRHAIDEQSHGAFLLHGVTGSGKTEIYLHAIARVLAQGKQAIFLVPEIALTPQTIRRVAERFPNQAAIVHGSLSPGERYDTWRRARNGEIGVIVGTRAALFTPLPDIGLIILDEEHDHSYKHQPPFHPPYYHARAVTEHLMQQKRGVVILGSATPDLESYYRAQRGDLTYLHLPARIMGHRARIQAQAARAGVTARYTPISDEALSIGLPPVHIVDMRDELKLGNRSIFSRLLHDQIEGVLERGEQAILFLNRRGQASYVFCRDCGETVVCARCSVPLTYHRAGDALHCHHCGHSQPAPTTCPTCGSSRIRHFGAGTQQVEEELKKEFPHARAVRWDAETAEKPADHEAILASFTNHEADILIGTQMIAKGLDLPMVTLVGVVNADPGLALPDFRASERGFQLLTQVAGRAGRGVLGGEVVLQTYQPEHPAIQAAARHDYARFYADEITARRNLGYPPFRRLVRLVVQAPQPHVAQRETDEAAALLRHRLERQHMTESSLIGPAPCFFGRIDRQYRWQVLLRSPNPLLALQDMPLKPNWSLDVDPVDLL